LTAGEEIEPGVTTARTGVMVHSITLMQDTCGRIIHEQVGPLVSGGFSKLKLTTGSTFSSIISMPWA
jgi:hypothetical protein